MDLWAEVQAVAAADPRLAVLDDVAARDLTQRAKSKFIEDPGTYWWWTSVRGESEWLEYEDALRGLSLLRTRITGQGRVNLLVIDEQTEPHGVVAGPGDAIVDLLAETPTFEFAVTDPELRWLILDTHHNCLVLVGDAPSH